jgi:small ligand-binding sensory domain FIST
MTQFKLGHSAGKQWQPVADEVIEQLGPCQDCNLAFIYVTDAFSNELSKLLRYLREQTGIAHWVGSIGNGICCTNTEYYDQPALAVLACQFPEQSFEVFDLASEEQKRSLADPNDFSLRPTVVHGDPRNGHLPQLIAELPEQLGNGYLIGGLTSSDSHYFQVADDLTEGSLSGVIFKDVPVVTGLSQGCTPITEPHVLTACDHHMAITIDDRPALDVFKEDIGEVLARDIDRAAGYIFAAFPVAGSDTGDYLVRNVIGFDPNNNLLAIGEHMTPDTPIMFCRRDGKSAVEDMQRMLNDVKKRLDGKTPKGGLYISCLGRGRSLFGDNSEEMKIISEVFGDIPLVGFYANGEIAGQRLYGYTGILTLFT